MPRRPARCGAGRDGARQLTRGTDHPGSAGRRLLELLHDGGGRGTTRGIGLLRGDRLRAGRLRHGGRHGRRGRAALRVGLHALRELGIALGSASRPLAQAPDLACLDEVQHRQHAQADDRGIAEVGTKALDLVAHSDRCKGHVIHDRRILVGQPSVTADSSETFAASPAASPSSTSSPIWSNMSSTACGARRSRSARRIFSAGVGCGRS